MGYASANDVAGAEELISTYDRIDWRFLQWFHSKYFLAYKGNSWAGFMGSFNFTDSTWEDIAVRINAKQAKEVAYYHESRRARAVPARRAGELIRLAFDKLGTQTYFSSNDTGG